MILKPSVGTVRDGSPALAAGLKPGDLITAIDGVPVNSWDEMTQIIGDSKGKTLEITIQRGNSQKAFMIKPELVQAKNIFGEDVKRYIIGISTSGDVDVLTATIGAYHGVSATHTYRWQE